MCPARLSGRPRPGCEEEGNVLITLLVVLGVDLAQRED